LRNLPAQRRLAFGLAVLIAILAAVPRAGSATLCLAVADHVHIQLDHAHDHDDDPAGRLRHVHDDCSHGHTHDDPAALAECEGACCAAALEAAEHDHLCITLQLPGNEVKPASAANVPPEVAFHLPRVLLCQSATELLPRILGRPPDLPLGRLGLSPPVLVRSTIFLI
jgi:hypothetical protein